MLIPNDVAVARLTSSSNLINKLRNGSTKSAKDRALSLFGVGRATPAEQIEKQEPPKFDMPSFQGGRLNIEPEPEEQVAAKEGEVLPPESDQPSLDNLLNNSASRIKLELIHNKALETLLASVNQIHDNLDDIKPEKLVTVAAGMSKIVETIRNEDKKGSGKEREVHVHFYTPERKKLADFERVTV